MTFVFKHGGTGSAFVCRHARPHRTGTPQATQRPPPSPSTLYSTRYIPLPLLNTNTRTSTPPRIRESTPYVFWVPYSPSGGIFIPWEGSRLILSHEAAISSGMGLPEMDDAPAIVVSSRTVYCLNQACENTCSRLNSVPRET